MGILWKSTGLWYKDREMLNYLSMRNLAWMSFLLFLVAAYELQTTTPTAEIVTNTVVVQSSATASETLAEVTETESATESATVALSETASATSTEADLFEEGINPLTGLLVDDLSLLDRRPVAVKITLYPRSIRPQWGLSLADIVYEYYHNNELTRFHAIFYGENANWAGPIRSARLPDEYLMDGYGSVMAFASADSRIRDQLYGSFPDWRLVSILEGTCPPNPVCRFDPEGFNHLLANTEELSEYIEAQWGNNKVQNLAGMHFADQKPKSNYEVERIYLRYSYSAYSYWDYDNGKRNYVRYQDSWDDVGGRGEAYYQLTDRLNGAAITAENVVVLYVNHFHFVYQPSNGNIPATEIVDIDLEGRGEAYAFRNGLAYALEWVRESDGVLHLEYEDGSPFDFKLGNTWFQIFTDDSKLDADGDTWNFNFVFPRP
jgi:hypothetical protein